ncbi:MAG: hypothetical protein Q9222_006657 [Ikaeria aurantiellina]
MSPSSKANPFDADPHSSSTTMRSDRHNGRIDSEQTSAIRMRKLPKSTSSESLRTMFLFAKDFIRAEFTESLEEGYRSAIAHFRTANAAQEARALLDGKQNTANETPMIVEVLRPSPGGGLGPRRNTSDVNSTRAATSSTSSTGSASAQAPRQTSQFNSAFQTYNRISPPASNGRMSSGDLHAPAHTSSYNMFNPPVSIGPHMSDRHRGSGKSLINGDGLDDGPGDLLKDSMAYAQHDLPGPLGPLTRRATSSQIPTSRFGGLSLSTSTATSPPLQSYMSPRSNGPLQSPTTAMSPTGLGNIGSNGGYQIPSQQYQRHNLPPVNPSDQNPPCNTLYVGNLPIDTSEDELKAMFSKQRGYKRLCFRTKQNGPMCFVEFEDISFATKALNELYGYPLHNSVKGGIRLSFSKNPLGVRNGQPGSMGPPTPLSPQGPMPGLNGLGSLPAFSTANGPPPGLAAPPGLSSPVGFSNGSVNGASGYINSSMMNGGSGSNGLGINGFASSGMRSPPGSTANAPWPTQNSFFSDHINGR